MLHVIHSQGQPAQHQGQTVWPHLTMCGLQVAFTQRLAPGTKVNAGTRSGEVCPECSAGCESLSFLAQEGDASVHSGTSEDQFGISRAVHDDSHGMDGGKVITRVSGLGGVLRKTEQGQESNGDFLGGYAPEADENGNALGTLENDPYGEGEAAQAKGAAWGKSQVNLHTQPPPYPKGSLLYRRFMQGYEMARMIC